MSNSIACTFLVDDRIFHRDAILKTAYLFTDRFFLHLSYFDEHHISIVVEAKPNQDISAIDKAFCNELLTQMLRYRLAEKTKNIKELIIGRALYSTCIDTDEDVSNSEEENFELYSLDDIAVNWFEVNSDDTNHPI